MYHYVTYGLGVQSELPLPELMAADRGADVVIRRGPVECPRLEPAGGIARLVPSAETNSLLLLVDDVGAFLMRAGREVVVDTAPGVDARVLRLALLGPVLAVLLQQRGRLVLHASAVALGGGAVALLGRPGWGKSTTAAALHQRGHPVVADDLTAVQLDQAGPVVFPGFAQLKLWPDAAAALGDDVERLPRLRPEFEKRGRPVIAATATTALPLRALYVLAEGEALAVEELPPADALTELMTHSYFVNQLPLIGIATHFRQCASLASSVPLRRLRRPLALDLLPAVARLVELDQPPAARSAPRLAPSAAATEAAAGRPED